MRSSGQTTDSAPIILEVPKGRVELQEGFIWASHHIHMHPDDTERFGVKNLERVEVAVTGGPRDLIFCDVLIRVGRKYQLEMHIDTDEANAAKSSSDHSGEFVCTGVDSAQARLTAKRTLAGNDECNFIIRSMFNNK